MGQNSRYTYEVMTMIFNRIAGGETLKRILDDPLWKNSYPDKTTFYQWIREYNDKDDLWRKYYQAKAQQSEAFIDESTDIADEIDDKNPVSATKAALRIKTRQFQAEKLASRIYGDKKHILHHLDNENDMNRVPELNSMSDARKLLKSAGILDDDIIDVEIEED